LVEKGYLSTEKEGRIFKYNVLVPFEEYKKFLLKELSLNFFNNSGKEILGFLISENLISQKDLKDFDINIETNSINTKEPEFEYANEVLNPKKDKKKIKDKDKKKKKKKDQEK
jgi:BlaI family penicillinase repressor